MSFEQRQTLWRSLVAIAGVIAISPVTTSAQSPLIAPNATVRGDMTALYQLATSTITPHCKRAPCDRRIPTTHLTLVSAEHHAVSVAIQSLRGTTAQRHAHHALDPQAPLLLRGTARLRHAGDNGATRVEPISATVFRRDGRMELEVGLPRRARKGRPLTGMTLIRVPFGERTDSRVTAARERHASAYGFANRGCPEGLTTNPRGSFSTQSASTGTAAHATLRPIYLSTDFDSEYASTKRCKTPESCNDKIVGLINQASLFYEKQFGITLEVARQFGPTVYTSTTSAYALLSDFTNSNNATRGDIIHDGINTSDNLIDVHQLFTGKMLDGLVVGLAFVQTTCPNSLSGAADMLVSALSDVIDPVTIAHELGHGMGARHTDAGIMRAAIRYPLPSAFSPISEQEIGTHLSSHYGECRGGAFTTYEKPSYSAPTLAPKTIELSVRRGARNAYIIRTKLSALSTGCSVTLRAAERASKALKGRVLTSFEPTGLVTSKRATVDQTINTTTTGGADVFIAAHYSCPNGNSVESSHAVRISPKARSSSSKRVSRLTWIRILSQAF